MKRVFLIIIGLSCMVNAEFVRDNGAEVVTDTSRGLMWQDNNVVTGAMQWKDALQYCENLELPKGGYRDWRLPNINELGTLVDYTKKGPTISKEFKNTVQWYYWSSTTGEKDHKSILAINFFGGAHEVKIKTNTSTNTRCVRDVQ